MSNDICMYDLSFSAREIGENGFISPFSHQAARPDPPRHLVEFLLTRLDLVLTTSHGQNKRRTRNFSQVIVFGVFSSPFAKR